MTDSPLYVIVHRRADRTPSANSVVVHDCHPDNSIEDVRERATDLQRAAKDYGRTDDTYRVAELRFVDEIGA